MSDTEALLLSERDKRCAPDKDWEAGSCITYSMLVNMAKAYNDELAATKSKEEPIKLSQKQEVLHGKKYKKYLVKEFTNRFKSVCDTQKCWMKQSFIKRMNKEHQLALKKSTFRPEGPKGRFEWLNTIHIRDVMKQYEDVYSDFDFWGAVPMDFDDLRELGIRNKNFDKMVGRGKKQVGVVFNLDEHDKPGSHWVSMYANMDKGQIYFFDSYGIRPDQRVGNLMKRMSKWCKENGKQVDLRYNTIRHQRENSECGVYSINFILRLLKGESFEEITKNITKDREVNKCRKVYFSNTNFKET